MCYIFYYFMNYCGLEGELFFQCFFQGSGVSIGIFFGYLSYCVIRFGQNSREFKCFSRVDDLMVNFFFIVFFDICEILVFLEVEEQFLISVYMIFDFIFVR